MIDFSTYKFHVGFAKIINIKRKDKIIKREQRKLNKEITKNTV